VLINSLLDKYFYNPHLIRLQSCIRRISTQCCSWTCVSTASTLHFQDLTESAGSTVDDKYNCVSMIPSPELHASRIKLFLLMEVFCMKLCIRLLYLTDSDINIRAQLIHPVFYISSGYLFVLPTWTT